MRFSLRILIGLAIVALVLQTWLVQGLVVPLMVSGGSMAPGLLGQHYHVVCHDCGRPFDCDQESTPSNLRALCPGCGAWCELESSEARPGERLFVDRTAFLRRPPDRWSLVVCPLPEDAAELCVKRVVGLPGERITLSDGDVYADGEILRKDWDVLSAMAILVDDAAYQPHDAGAELRWQPEREDSRWRATAAGFEIDKAAHSAGDANGPIDWIAYHHQQIWRQGDQAIHRPGPILDDLAYNQNESRELIAAPDVILSCRLTPADNGQIYLRADDGRRQFVVLLDLATRRGELREAEQTLARFDLPGTFVRQTSPDVGLALVDCRVQLIVSGALLVDYCYDPAAASPRQPTAEPLAIGATGMALAVTEWVVSRDIYYLPPPGKRALESRQLGPSEYWLAGDNTAVSDDSRTWPADVRVTRDALIGRILRWR